MHHRHCAPDPSDLKACLKRQAALNKASKVSEELALIIFTAVLEIECCCVSQAALDHKTNMVTGSH